MQDPISAPPKPISEIWRPELTCLPRLTAIRRFARRFFRGLLRLVLLCSARVIVRGLENYPRQGPALVVMNHLGDVDALVMLAYLPVLPEMLAKIELHEIPVLGPLMDAYGVIWIHRGTADRRALKAALEGLRIGRFVGVSPEGRESLTGGLEEATNGAIFLATRADVPVVPVTLTGTANSLIYGNLRRFRRSEISLTVGKPFRLPGIKHRREAMQEGTRIIMESLARQLPAEYRGVYGYVE